MVLSKYLLSDCPRDGQLSEPGLLNAEASKTGQEDVAQKARSMPTRHQTQMLWPRLISYFADVCHVLQPNRPDLNQTTQRSRNIAEQKEDVPPNWLPLRDTEKCISPSIPRSIHHSPWKWVSPKIAQRSVAVLTWVSAGTWISSSGA